MAISKIEKIQILAHNEIRRALIEDLQRFGVVEIADLREVSGETESSEEPLIKTDKEIETILSDIGFCLSFIDKYCPAPGVLEKLKEGKLVINSEELGQLIKSFSIQDCYKECRELEQQFHNITLEQTHLMSLREQMEPWKKIQVPLNQLQSTPDVNIKPIRIPIDIAEEFFREIDLPLIAFEKIFTDTSFVYGILFAHGEILDELSKTLTKFGLEGIDLAASTDTPKDSPKKIIRQVGLRLRELYTETDELKKKARQLDRHRQNLQILYDFYSNQKKRTLIQNNFLESQHTFFLEGWIRQRDSARVKTALEKNFSEIDIRFSEPGPDDQPPIDLSNSDLLGPFEPVTSLYGLPDYREADPTPILAPFFFVFFGLCLADLGYGVIMMVLTGYGLSRLKLDVGSKKMTTLFFYSGLATVLAGAITGSWFGDIFTYIGFAPLLGLQKKLVLFDPIKDPLTFMILALLLGFVQIATGLAVKFVGAIKEKKYADALCCEGAWLMFFLGLTLYGLIEINVLPLPQQVALWVIYFSVGVLFLFTERKSFNPLKRIGLGLLELYNIIGYFSDVLSYSRLLALGLASAVIANVVNQIASMTLSIPVLGYIMMILILVGGHVFNFMVSALGAYVHTSRLQYVEFFPKFFKGGGRLFSPFCRVADYSFVRD